MTYAQDQPAFMAALLHSFVKIYPLQNSYNFWLHCICSTIMQPVKILHGRHPDIRYVERIINASEDNRAWIPNQRKIITPARESRLREALYHMMSASLVPLWRRIKILLLSQ